GSVRAGGWLRRQRTFVAAAAATVLAVTLSLAVATVVLQAANTRERAANLLAQQNEREARAQQEQAMKNFQLARQAVDRHFTIVSQDRRLREHDLENLRRGLLQTAARFCDEFVRQRSDAPGARADQGSASLRSGAVMAA